MAEEKIETTHTETVPNVDKWYTPITRITPVSKALALALFVVLPFVGFWLGYVQDASTMPAGDVPTQTDEGSDGKQSVVKNTSIKVETESAQVQGVLHNPSLAKGEWSISLPNDHRRDDYRISNGVLYYNNYRAYEPLVEVDADTVEYFNSESMITSGYIRDKDHVLYHNRVIEGADPQSFWPLQSGSSNCVYAVDEHAVYKERVVLADADPKTITYLGDECWYTDARHVYFGATVLEDVDPKSFKLLNLGYSRDNDSVFFDGVLIANADAISFNVLGGGYRLPNPTEHYGAYAKDDTYVYINGEILEGADAATFQHLDHYYSKDARHVYFDNDVIVGADPGSFEVLGDDHGFSEIYARDKSSVYQGGVALPSVEPIGFDILGECVVYLQVDAPGINYIKDENAVYCGGNKLDADPTTFEVLGNWIVVEENQSGPVRGLVRARDKDSFYCGSFQIAPGSTALDDVDWSQCIQLYLN